MLPAELNRDSFAAYPPLAKQIALHHLTVLQALPLQFLPLFLRELIAYDWRFPAERLEIDQQIAFLNGLSAAQRQQLTAPFAALRLTPDLEKVDWVNEPAQFSEKFSAQLWASHQIDAFRAASVEYVRKVNAASPAQALPTHRLSIVVIGEGVPQNSYPLFRKLQSRGVHFQNLNGANGRKVLLNAVVARSAQYRVPFGHWYLDGAAGDPVETGDLTCVSYHSLQGVRAALLVKMQQAMQRNGGGPEYLRSLLAQLRPADLGLSEDGANGLLNRFQVSVLTEGSGTQIFSTTFVQWSAREVLRRAQPLTLFARFAPRQREGTIDEFVEDKQRPSLDPQGSLIDADLGAYYTWINLQRLPGAESARFLVWFENHSEAFAIAPGLPAGTADTQPVTLPELLTRLT